MSYAKLMDNVLVFAPRRLSDGETVVYNPPADILTARGWKPVVYTEAPTLEAGFAAVFSWTETEEAVVQTWTSVPEGDIPDAEALDIILGGGQV